MPDQLSEHKSIWVFIKLGGEGFASSPEFDLRYTLEDAVEERGIGTPQGAGSGGGWMDFSFGVENIVAVDAALAAMQDLLAEYHVPEQAVRLKVVNQYDTVCDDLPDYQQGDCITYRFSDGDFGAAIVLNLRKEKSNSEQTLLGVLDYKHKSRPSLSVFEERNWLISTHESSKGKPYLVWLHCYGGLEVEIIHRVSLKDDDPNECKFNLAWEDVPEYFIRDKYRGNKLLNIYESHYEFKRENRPNFKVGDCLSYRFDDGDFGAALVLRRPDDGLNQDEVLLGILDYKHQNRPSLSVFEQRNWLIATSKWRNGQPYLIWAQYCWVAECEGIGTEVVGQLSLKADDLMFCPFSLFWEDIPEYVLREKYGN